MKSVFIATIFSIIPILGFSQLNHAIDFIGGFEYSYRNLTTSSDDENVIGIMKGRDNKETGKFNWRVGFNYNQRLTNKIYLKTGIRLASVGYKGENITGIRWPSEYDEMGQWINDPSLPHEVQLVWDYWFLEIPIAGRFEINQKKLSPFFEIGISPTVYLTSRAMSKTDLGTDSEFQNGKFNNFNKVHFVGFISFGINYSVNEKFQFFGQPVFRYHLSKLADAPIHEYLYNYGVEIGIRRKF